MLKKIKTPELTEKNTQMTTKKIDQKPFAVQAKLRQLETRQKELNSMLDVLEQKWKSIMIKMHGKD